MHWTEQFASGGRVDALVTDQADPFSGQPALKMARVLAEPASIALHGFFVSRVRPRLDSTYWAVAEAPEGLRGELGWESEPRNLDTWLRLSFGLTQDARIVSVVDNSTGRRSFAAIESGRLVVALYTSPDPVLVSRQWAVGLLGEEGLAASSVLAGRPGADMPDVGAIVCSCHSVGINTIAAAVADGCMSVDAVGAATRAGTNCGSGRAEIRALIAAARPVAAE